MRRLIFHIDVNSAFLSWTAAALVKAGKPDIREVPSAIGGDRERRAGIILAKSIPAKKYGVTTGEPIGLALKKCPNLLIFPPDFKLYAENSRAFMKICANYSPLIEQYSIDECFLDMSGMELLFADPLQAAHEIRQKIKDELGFTVNIGVGENKLLAKMASDFSKPDKVHTLFLSEIEQKMWPLPIGDLLYVGPAIASKLQRVGIRTIGDVVRYQLKTLQSILGDKAGEQLFNYVRGQDESPVLGQPSDIKCLSISTTLPNDILSMELAFPVICALAESLTYRLRRAGKMAGTISVTVRGNDFKDRSHQRRLNEPTDITKEIIALAKELLRELWDEKLPIRLLGISLGHLTAGVIKPALFPDEKREKARRLDAAVDALKDKYGAKSIYLGSAADEEALRERAEKRGK